MRKQYLVQFILGSVLILGGSIFSPKLWADDTAQLKDQIQALQNRVDQLESQLANRQPAVQSAVKAPAPMPVYDQWDDPFRQMMLMQEQMERNMRRAFSGTAVFNPRMDMKQADKQYVITMDIPGMDRDKINIETKQDMLIVSGERRSEAEDSKNNQYYRQERSFGSFMQAIPLPEDARKDKIEAKYENGVLTVTIVRLKKEDKKPESQKIVVK
jgi:HSP20 family molecular chaperone IbpA